MEKCRSAGIGVIDCAPKNVSSLSDSLKKRAGAVFAGVCRAFGIAGAEVDGVRYLRGSGK
jgi:hypothetical protein